MEKFKICTKAALEDKHKQRNSLAYNDHQQSSAISCIYTSATNGLAYPIAFLSFWLLYMRKSLVHKSPKVIQTL